MATLDLVCTDCQGNGWVWDDPAERQVSCPWCDGTGTGVRTASPDWFVLVDTGTPIEPAATLVGPFFHEGAAQDFISSVGPEATTQLLAAIDPDRVRVGKGR
jgi:hypothetical protein